MLMHTPVTTSRPNYMACTVEMKNKLKNTKKKCNLIFFSPYESGHTTHAHTQSQAFFMNLNKINVDINNNNNKKTHK